VILAEHEKIAIGQLEEKELEKAKEMLKGRLLLSFEDSNNLASFVGRKLMFEEN
jgi:predicted Zn-dependent peptidase